MTPLRSPRAPGIGKKTAQKIILELKDKMDLQDAFEQKLMHQQEAQAEGRGADLAVHEAVQALTALWILKFQTPSACGKTDRQHGGMDAEAVLKAGTEETDVMKYSMNGMKADG